MIDFSRLQDIKRKHHSWVVNNFDKYGLGSYKTAGQIMKYLWKYNPDNIQVFLRKWVKAKSRYTMFENVVLRIKQIRQCTLQDAAETAFIGIFYHSYLGYKAEIEAIKYLENKYNGKAVKADSKLDNKYAVDLIFKKDNAVAAVQVKSENSRYNYTGTDYDKRNKRKNHMFELVYGHPVQYLYYQYSYNSSKLDFDIWFEEKDKPKLPTLDELLGRKKEGN